jgi:hypothetical protein
MKNAFRRKYSSKKVVSWALWRSQFHTDGASPLPSNNNEVVSQIRDLCIETDGGGELELVLGTIKTEIACDRIENFW